MWTWVIVATARILRFLWRHPLNPQESESEHDHASVRQMMHKTVLEGFNNLDSILTPEKEAAREFGLVIDLHVNVESFQIDEEHM